MWIDIKMAYEAGGKIARAYNRAMESTTAEWVLFLDHDLFICNRHWYDMSLEAIKQVGGDAGWITAVTNRIGAPQQRCKDAPESHDLREHFDYAKQRYLKYGRNVMRVPGALSGFFILTNKTVWSKAGGFNEKRGGLLGVDNDYSRAVQQAGYKLYIIPGLYFYHLYRQKKKFMRW